MANYTRPNNENHVDDPKDWLNSALIFTAAIGILLQENEGISVKIKGDMFNPNGERNIVIVYKSKNQICVMEAPAEITEEGQYIWVDE